MKWTKTIAISLFAIAPLFLSGCISFSNEDAPMSQHGGVFKTIDGGETWVSKSSVATIQNKEVNFHSLDVMDLVTDPQDEATLYAATSQGLFFSYDFGESWQQSRGMKMGKINGVAVHPKESCTIFVTTGRYVYKTEDCGRSFEDIYLHDNPSVEMGPILIDSYNPDIMYVGAVNGDLMKTSDGGKSWSVKVRFKKPIVELLHGKDTRTIFAAVFKEGVLISTDGADTWLKKEILAPQKEFEGFKMVYDIDYDAKTNTLIAASNYGLLKTTDDGKTWQAVPVLPAPGATPLYAVAFDPNNSDNIFYATAHSFDYSVDGGANWVSRHLPTASRMGAILVKSAASKSDMKTGGNAITTVMAGFRIIKE